MNGLSEAEVEEIRAACLDGWTDPAIAVTIARAITPAVEAIVATRLASVEAVHWRYFDEEGDPGVDDTTPEPEDVWRYDRDFRAVLGSDAHTEQKGTGE